MHATSVTVGFLLSIAAMGALFGTFIVNWLHDKLSFNSTLTLMLILQICARLPLLYKVNNISIYYGGVYCLRLRFYPQHRNYHESSRYR